MGRRAVFAFRLLCEGAPSNLGRASDGRGLQGQDLARLDAVYLSFGLQPEGKGAGVADHAAVGGILQLLPGQQIVGDIPVAGKPDLVGEGGDKPGKIFYYLPVVVLVELVGVAPEIKQPGPEKAGLLAAEGLGQFHELGVPVMAGGVPGQQVLGRSKP